MLPGAEITNSAPDPYYFIEDLKKFHRKKAYVASLHVRKYRTVLKSKKVILKVPNKSVCDEKRSPKAARMFVLELELQL